MKYLTVFVRGEVRAISRKNRLKRNIWKRCLKPPYGRPAEVTVKAGCLPQSRTKISLQKSTDLLREGFQHWTPDDDYPGKLGAKANAQREDCHFFHHAPTLIIASNRPNYENAMADCALALENIFLAAHSLGLGSCYINHLHWLRNDPGLRNYLFELGIPKEHTICSAAAVGYIGKESSIPARKDGTIHIIK